MGHWNGDRDCEPAQLTEYQATVRARMGDMNRGERLLRVPSAETPPRSPGGGVLLTPPPPVPLSPPPVLFRLSLDRRCCQPPLKMIERLAIVSTGRNGLFQVPVPPWQFGQTRVLNTHAPICPIAVSYPNRVRIPPRQPTRSGHYVLLRLLLCRQCPC